MSERRFFDEYRDPDYGPFQSSRLQPDDTHKSAEDAKTETRAEAICRVVNREFQVELTNKEKELYEINKRIEDAKHLLAKVRYAVVYHYYNRKELICPEEELLAVQKSQQESMTNYPIPGDKMQMAIHPSLKKLLGKRPINYDEILKSRGQRKAAQNATEQFHKMAKKPAEPLKLKVGEPVVKLADDSKDIKKPRYVPPSTFNTTVPQVNSARGRNNFRHLLAVGNISKYIGHEEDTSETSVTHKWLIYVSTKTDVPVENIVSRARFFLHKSYKPNDIVEVSSPPFQLTKRGWGEFPVRVQLYFHAHLMQKPLQIYHTLVLDQKHTGLQTMGAETIVELWLNTPNSEDDNSNSTPSTSGISSSEGLIAASNLCTPFASVASASKPSTSSCGSTAADLGAIGSSAIDCSAYSSVLSPSAYTSSASNSSIYNSSAFNASTSALSPSDAFAPNSFLSNVSYQHLPSTSQNVPPCIDYPTQPSSRASTQPYDNQVLPNEIAVKLEPGQEFTQFAQQNPLLAVNIKTEPTSSIIPAAGSFNAPQSMTCDQSTANIPSVNSLMPSPIAKLQNQVSPALNRQTAVNQENVRNQVNAMNTTNQIVKSQTETNHPNVTNLQNLQTVTQVRMKSQNSIVATSNLTVATAVTPICTPTNITSTSTSATVSPLVKGNLRKTFMKCVGKDGKVSLVEVVQDDKNPKLFKMVLPTSKANTPVVTPYCITVAPTTMQMNRMPLPQITTLQGIVRPTIPVVMNSSQLMRPLGPPNVACRPKIIGSPAISPAKIVASTSQRPPIIASPLKMPGSSITSSIPAKMPKLVLINSPRSTSVGSPNKMATTQVALNEGSMNVSSNLSSSSNLLTPSKQQLNLSGHSLNGSPKESSLPIAGSSFTNARPMAGIIQKNNKLLANRVPQQSLLKPQVSLLKPRLPVNAGSPVKKITVTNISGLKSKNINIFMPPDFNLDLKPMPAKARPASQVHSEEIEKRFLARTFTHMTDAVGWLLKKISLISPMAAQSEYRESFPFVVANANEFYNLTITKQRCFEWLRAKHINRMIAKHQSLKDLSSWTTKEIVVFGRWFGYMPPSVQNPTKSTIDEDKSGNVHEMVKSELMREHLHNDIISFNNKLINWIEGVEDTGIKCSNHITNDEIISVDEQDDEDSGRSQTSPTKAGKNYLQVAVQTGHDEMMWIHEVCRRTQIRFQQEEIVEGVLHRSAEHVFAIALRSFLEDLLRKCAGNKKSTIKSQSLNAEINNDDVLRTISTIQHFDFLTNKNLGITKTLPT